MPTKKPSARYSLSREDFEKILTAFVFSGLAAIISGLIAVVSSPELDLPAWVVPLVPAINTFLYGALKYSTGPKA